MFLMVVCCLSLYEHKLDQKNQLTSANENTKLKGMATFGGKITSTKMQAKFKNSESIINYHLLT